MPKTNNPNTCPICGGSSFKYDADIEGQICQQCGATVMPPENKK